MQGLADTRRPQCRRLLIALGIAVAALPGSAQAHGPVAPVASAYEARIILLPPNLQAEVIDGDQRLWLRVAVGHSAVVLDPRGAPFLRFGPGGEVDVNANSELSYLNAVPVALVPPTGLTAATPPRWRPAAHGHEYGWHDGRLHALAAVALTPGQRTVGRWLVPVIVDGRRTAIAGVLYHAPAPSPAWFWPILVVLGCLAAALRLHRPALDAGLARGLMLVALLAAGLAAAAHELHGRPHVGAFSLLALAAILAFAGWAGFRVLRRRAGYLTVFAAAFLAIWQGAELLPTLLDGFTLTAVPGPLVRVAAVACLAAGAGLLPLGFRLADQVPAVS